MMPLAALGRTGLRVSRLGFGVSGPHGLALVAAAHTRALIGAAYAGGVRLFDTAPFYGDAQARLGDALAEHGAGDAVLVSKAGTARDGLRLRKDFAPQSVRDSILRSVDGLRGRCLDVLLLHGPPARPLEDKLRAVLEGLRGQGLIGHIGVSGRGEEIAVLGSDPLIEVVQAPVWSAWPAWCAENGLGFLGIEALAPWQPHRPWLPRSGADIWYLARRVWRGTSVVSGERPDPAGVYRGALAQKGVSAVLMTTTRLEHLHANLACANRG